MLACLQDVSLTPFDPAKQLCQANYLDRFSPKHFKGISNLTLTNSGTCMTCRKYETSDGFHSSCNYRSFSMLGLKSCVSINGGNRGISKTQQYGLAKRGKKHNARKHSAPAKEKDKRSGGGGEKRSRPPTQYLLIQPLLLLFTDEVVSQNTLRSLLSYFLQASSKPRRS